MTSGTITGNRSMIEICRYPAAGGMAVSTVIGTDDMPAVFAGGNTAVVTAHTGTLHMGVIDPGGGRPRRDCMTTLADLGRLDMASVLTIGRGAVVAARAVIGYPRVVVGT